MFPALSPERLPESQDEVGSFLLDDSPAFLPVRSGLLVPEQRERPVQDTVYPLAGMVSGDKLAG